MLRQREKNMVGGRNRTSGGSGGEGGWHEMKVAASGEHHESVSSGSLFDANHSV